jgi:elongation factor P
MKISVNELKPGTIIIYRERLWTMVKGEHVKPGKGPAYLQAELKGLPDGTKLNQRFNTSDVVERIELDRAECQFLYDEGGQLNLMDGASFEQLTIDRQLMGDAAVYLKEGMMVTVQSFEGRALSVRIPETVVLEVVEADPVVKGQTAASSYKPARLENGLRVLVPPHVESGTRIVVNTSDGSYVERARD